MNLQWFRGKSYGFHDCQCHQLWLKFSCSDGKVKLVPNFQPTAIQKSARHNTNKQTEASITLKHHLFDQSGDDGEATYMVSQLAMPGSDLLTKCQFFSYLLSKKTQSFPTIAQPKSKPSGVMMHYQWLLTHFTCSLWIYNEWWCYDVQSSLGLRRPSALNNHDTFWCGLGENIDALSKSKPQSAIMRQHQFQLTNFSYASCRSSEWSYIMMCNSKSNSQSQQNICTQPWQFLGKVAVKISTNSHQAEPEPIPSASRQYQLSVVVSSFFIWWLA